MSSRRDELEHSYRDTHYRLQLPKGPVTRRIGEADADADRRLREEAGCRARWALITAWNPQSERVSEAENRRLQQALAADLRALNLRYLPAVHANPHAQWPDEESFLLIDADTAVLERLGQQYRQNAVVVAELGGAPALLWL